MHNQMHIYKVNLECKNVQNYENYNNPRMESGDGDEFIFEVIYVCFFYVSVHLLSLFFFCNYVIFLQCPFHQCISLCVCMYGGRGSTVNYRQTPTTTTTKAKTTKICIILQIGDKGLILLNDLKMFY